LGLDEEEETKKEELRQQAKKELEQFYAQRKTQLELRKKQNQLVFEIIFS